MKILHCRIFQDIYGGIRFVNDRQDDVALVRTALKRSRIVALLGPRQCGKTTLARQSVAPDSLNYFDLEDPQNLARLSEPDLALRPLKKLVVIDEIQRRPDPFPLLRVLADRSPLPARFLILGNASPDLLRQSSETLAGRIETIALEGFRLSDLGASAQGRHWFWANRGSRGSEQINEGSTQLVKDNRVEASLRSGVRQFIRDTFAECPMVSAAINSLQLLDLFGFE
jgi:predicted AAA+ superfamily ATPase